MKSKQIVHITAIVAIGLVSTAAASATPPPLPAFETVQGFPLGPQQPACKTIRDAAGNTYGTTYNGGAYRAGTVFKVKPNGDIITLHHFDITQGTQPTGLTVGNDDNFYGATMAGGASNAGTFFKITPAGVFTQLHEFTEATDGSMPVSRLLKGLTEISMEPLSRAVQTDWAPSTRSPRQEPSACSSTGTTIPWVGGRTATWCKERMAISTAPTAP